MNLVIRGYAGRKAHMEMQGRPDCSSVVVVDGEGVAEEKFQIGHQGDLCAEVALDLLKNPGIRIKKSPTKEGE